jgi:outer membrane protein TolC
LLDGADAQLADRRRELAALAGSSEVAIAELAAIVGVSPTQLGSLQSRPLPVETRGLPEDARLGLIARRPDIVAARWLVEASSRGIDETRAAYYPDVSLMALGGYLLAYPDLGSGKSTSLTLGSIGPSISLPIFSGGRLKADFEGSQAQLDQAVADYNRTVVQAAREVAQQVSTLQQLDAENQQQHRAFLDGTAQLQRTAHRRDEGIIDDRSYLQAQLQLDQQRDALEQIQGQQLAAGLSLTHALGGGYYADRVPPLPSPAAKEKSQ